MSIRSILVPFFESPKANAALDLAITVAERFDCHVHAVHARLENWDVLDTLDSPLLSSRQDELTQVFRARVDERVDSARRQFDAVVGERGIKFAEAMAADDLPMVTWAVTNEPEFETITASGAVYDLIVVGGPSSDDENDPVTLCAESALFRAGRPMLLTAPDRGNSVGERVLLAWNRSALSAHAVSAALPFLRGAEAVRLLTVETGAKQGPPPEALADSLRLHGVDAEVRKIAPDYRGIGEVILDEAEEYNADLVVAGAYSSSRFREMIFGGVTRYMLENVNRPILLVH